MTLRVGLSAYDISAAELVRLATAADVAGFESLWLGEHIVLPSDYGSEHPTTGDEMFFDAPLPDDLAELAGALEAYNKARAR